MHPDPERGHAAVLGFAVHQGWMSFPGAVVAATAGNLVGSLIAYAFGATRALERIPGASGVLRSSERLLERHGTRAVLIARLLPIRTAIRTARVPCLSSSCSELRSTPQ